MQRYVRIALIAAMMATAYMMVLAWQKDYGGQNAQTTQTTQPAAQGASASTADVPAVAGAASATGDLPPATAPAQNTGDVPVLANATNPAATMVAKANNLIDVTTDKYHLKINPVGGDIVELTLRDYKAKLDGQADLVLLENGSRTYLAQSGLQGANGTDTAEGRATYTSAQKSYEMSGDALVVPLTFNQNGVTITKSFTFKKGDYPIDVNYNINNPTANPWIGNFYAQLKRDGSSDPGQENRGFMSMATYLGGAWGTPDEPYNKIKFDEFSDEDDKLNVKAQNGWIAMVQHYFVSSWIPKKDQAVNFYTYQNQGNNFIGFSTDQFIVAPNKQHNVSASLYAGPKIQNNLKPLAKGLDQTVDFGFLWPIAKFLYWLLKMIQGVIGNWGWAIIALTILVKLAFFPISHKAYKSMGKMRVIAPKMQKMKEEFGEDRMRFSQEMMKLYKEEKVNPMSGCLPILIQMPIFIALYWVLVESVELRHAPWVGWIQDLSHMDPWFILPIIMGVSMYVSQMLNPQPTDPMQAKVFKFLPIIFTVFMLFFPAGLVLYWVVNNLFTVGQQTYINKSLEKEQAAKAS